jgi:valyl-tRNA synthetase
VSNLNIIELKPDLIFTARGTVGIEMAYFEIPVVALYDNPYVNFNFVYTARTKEEYYSILRGEKSIKIDFDKKKIYSFYYQAYIEKTSYDTENIIGLLASFNGNTYCDEYLEMIRQNSDQIFSDKTLALFETSYFNENIQQAY